MCRNIKPLYNFAPATSDEEIRAAATQFVRKISGFSKPSVINAAVFDSAVAEITASAKKMFDSLITNAPPKDRAIENEKAKERNDLRFGQAKTD